ncbi:hypothetical protein N9M86_05425 [Euryarchaeota archaeon]|nr:hypothetical protein [Euryarchaeota archaeon]
MDPKAPRLATASLVLGLIAAVCAIVSSVLKLGFVDGFGTEEMAMVIVSTVLFIVSFLASREREQMEMISAPTLEEQFSAIESMPTQFRSSSTNVDSIEFETKPAEASQPQAMATSLLGDFKDVQPENVTDAFATLSTGMGSVGTQHVEMNPAPHRHTQQGREVFKSSRSTEDTFDRLEVQNIPLPGQVNTKPTPELPWQTSNREFQTEGSAQVSLPTQITQPVPQTEVQVEPIAESQMRIDHLPSMPNLDELFEAPPAQTVSHLPEQPSTPSLPDLPNLDDLF